MKQKRVSVFIKDDEDKAREAENREAQNKIEEEVRKRQEEAAIEAANEEPVGETILETHAVEHVTPVEENREQKDDVPSDNSTTQLDDAQPLAADESHEEKASAEPIAKVEAPAQKEKTTDASSESRHGKIKAGKTLTTMSIDEDAYDALDEIMSLTRKRTGNKKFGRGDAASEAILYYYNNIFDKSGAK